MITFAWLTNQKDHKEVSIQLVMKIIQKHLRANKDFVTIA